MTENYRPEQGSVRTSGTWFTDLLKAASEWKDPAGAMNSFLVTRTNRHLDSLKEGVVALEHLIQEEEAVDASKKNEKLARLRLFKKAFERRIHRLEN